MARSEGIDALMDKHHLDAIVAPTGGLSFAVAVLAPSPVLPAAAASTASPLQPFLAAPAGAEAPHATP